MDQQRVEVLCKKLAEVGEEVVIFDSSWREMIRGTVIGLTRFPTDHSADKLLSINVTHNQDSQRRLQRIEREYVMRWVWDMGIRRIRHITKELADEVGFV